MSWHLSSFFSSLSLPLPPREKNNMAPAPPGAAVPTNAKGAGLLDLDVECHRLVREEGRLRREKRMRRRSEPSLFFFSLKKL